MHYYKLKISYQGTNYSGWQAQSNTKNTVQTQIEQVIASIINFEKFELVASSRTDSGVHAHAQIIKLGLPKSIEPYKLMRGLNTKLPTDIRIIAIEFVEKSFNPQIDYKLKEYHYYFTDAPIEFSHLTQIIYHHDSPLNIKLITQGANLFNGTHDGKLTLTQLKSSLKGEHFFEPTKAKAYGLHLFDIT
jgi:tRNA pseudouridine38-40 synthase